MLPITKAELRKGGERYTNKFKILVALIVVLSLSVSVLSYKYGFLSDSWIYTSASDVYVIENRLFAHFLVKTPQEGLNMLKSHELDVFVTDRAIFITNSFKSHSAGEELKEYIDREFTRWLYENYGISAFPVFLRVEYLEREQSLEFRPQPETTSPQEGGKIPSASGRDAQRNGMSENSQRMEERIRRSIDEGSTMPEKSEYVIPDYFSPPSLISKMVVAFVFIIPTLFSMQLYTSSLAEDVRMRRIEILLASPLPSYSLLFQKLLPYFLISMAMVAVTSLIFKVNGLVFMLLPILSFFSFQTFIALNSRSYRELTFLVLVYNLFLITYLVLPSVFSGLPLSDLSPLTFLLRELSGEEVSFLDLLFSNLILAGFTVMGFVLSASSLNIEVLYSPKSPFGRLAEVIKNSAKSDLHAFFLAFLSVFLALFFEFFLLFFGISVPVVTSLPVVMLGVATIEEALKSILILPSRSVKRAVIVASGFFIAEKGILFLEAFKDFSLVLPGELLIFPLILHATASSLFAVMSKRSWKIGYLLAVAVHFAYNYCMVIGL